MIPRIASRLAFIVTTAGAVIAAAIVFGANAGETSVADTPLAASASSRASELSVQELKDYYIACERAASHPDFAPALCAVLYEELRVRGFGGSTDALLTWFKGAWAARRGNL